MLRKFILIVLLLITAMVAQAQEEEVELLTFTFEELDRTYLLHVPENVQDPAPLVIVLHGRFGDGKSVAELTKFDTVADREGFITVYPDGINGEWNFVRGVTGFDDQHNDVAFLIALVDHIAESTPVDLTRVYIAGFSNGGFMAQRVACENPTRFAGFASVAASGFGGMLSVCMEAGLETAPMLLMHGTNDDNIRWEGNSVTRGDKTVYITHPVLDTLVYWAAFNNCEGDLDSEDLPEFSARKLTVVCPEDTGVILYAVIGGGHGWPINATEEIWDFFSQQTREE